MRRARCNPAVRAYSAVVGAISLALAHAAPAIAAAQAQAPERPRVSVPKSLREAELVDLTGYWVAHGSEDYVTRWIVAPPGEYFGVPLNATGRQVADRWDPAADAAAGLECKAYGAAGLMRLPGRIHVTWEDDNTLKIDTDTGQQTRRLVFGAPPPSSTEQSWQGHSSAIWQTSTDMHAAAAGGRGGRSGGDAARRSRHAGKLKVVTTNLRAGYLRKNGVPYSDRARMTEYFTRTAGPNGDEWLIVVTIVEDPTYLNEPFVTSTNFRKELDGAKWDPTPCSTTEPR